MHNVTICKRYDPPSRTESDDPRRALAAAVQEGSLSLTELEKRYCTLVYSQAETWGEAAHRLGIDRRTLIEKIDRELLERLR